MKIAAILLVSVLSFSSQSMVNEQHHTCNSSKVVSTVSDITCSTAVCCLVGKACIEIVHTKHALIKQLTLNSGIIGINETNNLIRMLSNSTGRIPRYISLSAWIGILGAHYLYKHLPFMKITCCVISMMFPWMLRISKFNKTAETIVEILNYVK